MSELKPCPFCGGEEINIRAVSFANGSVQMWIECALCPAHTERTNDLDTAIEVWNTREQTVFGMTLDEVRQMMKRDAERERTCKLVRHGSLANMPSFVCWSCSECGFGWHHSENDKQFSYCPNCGRKVVSE